LRLIGRRNSGTRFAVWFCALLAIAFRRSLKWFCARRAPASIDRRGHHARAWALYLFSAWAVIAWLGLFRVAAGFGIADDSEELQRS